MKQFTETQQIGFRKMIKHDAWINTALLSLLAYKSPSDKLGGIIVVLFLTWSLFRMQKAELNFNSRFMFTGFSFIQNGILVLTIMALVHAYYTGA